MKTDLEPTGYSQVTHVVYAELNQNYLNYHISYIIHLYISHTVCNYSANTSGFWSTGLLIYKVISN